MALILGGKEAEAKNKPKVIENTSDIHIDNI